MQVFACWCRDADGSAPKRKEFAPAHFEYFEKVIDRFLIAGPMKDGDLTVGSVLIVKADSADDARALLAGDPYFDAGIWETIEIEPFVPAAGEWVGGVTWK